MTHQHDPGVAGTSVAAHVPPPPGHTVEHAGRRIEVRLDDVRDRGVRVRDLRVRLFVDDREVDAVGLTARKWVLRHDGTEVRVRPSTWGTRIRSAELVLPGGGTVPLVEVPVEPGPPGADADVPPRLLPAEGTPDRAKLWCGTAIALSIGWSFALNPFRPVLLQAPLALAALTGSRTAMVLLGASTAVGRTELWWLGLLLGTVSVAVFHPLYWWAGRLWGDRAVAFVRGGRPVPPRVLELAHRWRGPALVAPYVPGLPVPGPVVQALAGATGMRLRTFLLVDLTTAFATRCLWFHLGFRLGQPVMDAVDAVIAAISGYTLWISLAVLVGPAVLAEVRRRRQVRSRGTGTAPDAGAGVPVHGGADGGPPGPGDPDLR